MDAMENAGRGFSAPRPKTGRGRPAVQVELSQLQLFIDQGFTAPQIANNLGCSESVVRKKMAAYNLKMRNKYSNIPDDELRVKVAHLEKEHPHAGEKMMTAYLKSEGIQAQRVKVRKALKDVNPSAVAQRWQQTTKRRTYKVACPNALWHIDAHMKLIRWAFVTHGCIDGASRLITFLSCTTDNTASTSLNLFVQACMKYGLPSRVRCDHGSENMQIGLFMNLLRAPDSAIGTLTGKSVHNQRIERLWRDVFEQVISVFYNLFYRMEDDGILSIDNAVHLHALHKVFLPEIQQRLTRFHVAWNKHKIRTEKEQTPEQLWTSGILHNIHSNNSAVSYLFTDEIPSIHTKLCESLEYFGLDIEQFEEPGNHREVHTTNIGLSEMESADIFNDVLTSCDPSAASEALYAMFVAKLEAAIAENTN